MKTPVMRGVILQEQGQFAFHNNFPYAVMYLPTSHSKQSKVFTREHKDTVKTFLTLTELKD